MSVPSPTSGVLTKGALTTFGVVVVSLLTERRLRGAHGRIASYSHPSEVDGVGSIDQGCRPCRI